MTGMTPAWLTFSGRYVDVPPYMRLPTMRLAYCTGMRRWPCSTNTTPMMMISAATQTAANTMAAAAVQDGLALERDAGRDAGEDHQRHAVADAALGDQLAHPHHQRRACGHHQHDDDEA